MVHRRSPSVVGGIRCPPFALYNTAAPRIHARPRRMAHRIDVGVARSSHEEARWRSASTQDDPPTHRCWSTSIGSCARTSRSGPTRPIPHSASRSGHRGTAVRRSTARSTRPTSRPRPRRSAATARARAPTARCSSGWTRTPSPSRRSGPRSGSWSRTTSTSASMPPTATRRLRPSRTRSSSTTAAAATTSPTASS